MKASQQRCGVQRLAVCGLCRMVDPSWLAGVFMRPGLLACHGYELKTLLFEH